MKNKLSFLAIAVATAFPMVQSAYAQSNAELKRELEQLKLQMQQLTQKLDAAPQGAVDPQEFNRIKIKSESTEDSVEASGLKGFKVGGVIDPTYIYSSSQKRSGVTFLNNLSGEASSIYPGGSADANAYAFDNSYFGTASLDIQKETASGSKWRLTLMPHKSAGSAYRAGSIVHEASVSVPLSDEKTRLIAGQIPDWSGYELSGANGNPLVTHNMLFDFSALTYYTGAGMEVTRGPWIGKFVVGNVNQAAREKGDSPLAWTYRGDYTINEYSGIGFSGGHAFSDTNRTDNAGRFDLFEVDGFYTRGDLTLQGQLGLGRQKGKSSNGGDAQWTGLSGLIGYKVTPRTQLITRVDFINNSKNGGGMFGGVFDNRNGFGPAYEFLDDGTGTGTNAWIQPNPDKGVNRYALSLGMNYLINPTTTLKTELRFDGANGAVFSQQDGSYKKNNVLFGTSIVVSF
jgi:hypothetical protein